MLWEIIKFIFQNNFFHAPIVAKSSTAWVDCNDMKKDTKEQENTQIWCVKSCQSETKNTLQDKRMTRILSDYTVVGQQKIFFPTFQMNNFLLY